MKALKRTAIVLSSIVVLLAVTGNNHIYLGLYDTYLQGRTKPGVDDPDLFSTRTIISSAPQAWPESKNYNQKKLSALANTTNQENQTLGLLVIKKDSLVFKIKF